jgi:hypothetical protein
VTVYSSRFYAGQLAISASSPVITVPSTVIWVLKDVQARQSAVTGAYVLMTLVLGGATVYQDVPNLSGAAYFSGMIVMYGGDTMMFTAEASAASVIASGYSFSSTGSG